MLDKIDKARRQDADRFFANKMKDAEGYGRQSDDAKKMGNIAEVKRCEEKIREVQKDLKATINFKLKDNQRLGRSYNDGKFL